MNNSKLKQFQRQLDKVLKNKSNQIQSDVLISSIDELNIADDWCHKQNLWYKIEFKNGLFWLRLNFDQKWNPHLKVNNQKKLKPKVLQATENNRHYLEMTKIGIIAGFITTLIIALIAAGITQHHWLVGTTTFVILLMLEMFWIYHRFKIFYAQQQEIQKLKNKK